MIRFAQSEIRVKSRILSLLDKSWKPKPSGLQRDEDEDSSETFLQSLKVQLEEINNMMDARVKAVLKDLSQARDEVESLREDLATRKDKIDTMRTELRQMSDTMYEATTRAEEARQETSEVIQAREELESKLKVAETRARELESELEGSTAPSRDDWVGRDEHTLVVAELEALRTDHSQLEERLSVLLSERDQMAAVDASSLAVVEGERESLKLLVAELQDELDEANDALQLHITNEASDKAITVVIETLKRQTDELKERLAAEEEKGHEERDCRIAAEDLADRLRGDLAALLGLDENADTSEIQRRTLEVSEEMFLKERSEIDELKGVLSRALDELEQTRGNERLAIEEISTLKHDLARCERELVQSRDDLKSMTLAMDEIRDAESTRRMVVDNRISEQERERSVSLRFHESEIENLRNELSQLTMERDRLFLSLRQSESSKDAILNASMLDASMEDDVRTEVLQLRVEKTELLTSLAEERSRSEQRLREIRAALKSSAEADVIVEKELRMAAEAALESARLEIADLRSEMNGHWGSGAMVSFNEVTELQDEMKLLRSELDSVTDENAALRCRMEEAREDSRRKMDKLVEENRLAKSRVNQLERESRYEAEILAEVSKMRTPRREVNPADENEDPSDDTQAELFAVIQQQKSAIEEERKLYFELVTEHDDLLAVLAQQDLVVQSLNTALRDGLGEEAVADAIHRAEHQAMEKYGKYVKLT